MPPLEPWEDAWLNNKAMPPNAFPAELLDFLMERLEMWMGDGIGPRTQLQEFVTRDRSFAILEGLLYSGFCKRRNDPRRLAPVPLIVQMLYRTPASADADEMAALMKTVFARVLSEWSRLHCSGSQYDVAP